MNWLKNIKVSSKLLILSISSLVFIILVGGLGYLTLNQTSEETMSMYENNLLPIKWVNDIRAQTRANEALIKELILTAEEGMDEGVVTEIMERGQNVNDNVQDYSNSELTDFEEEYLQQIQQLAKDLQAERENIYPIIKRGDADEAYSFYQNTLAPIINQINGLSQELADFNADEADKLINQIQEQGRETGIFLVSIILIAAIVSVLFGTIISRRITNPIKVLVSDMEKAGGGDLTVQGNYSAKDEIGILVASFNQMLQNMHKAIGEVTENANNLAASAEEISASTEEIASGSAQQAQDANTSSDMVSEMTNAIEEVSENAQGASSLADQTTNAAEQGKVVISDTIHSMEEITTNINDLADKSVKIGEIIEVIDDIAEQTNLLALNAAIEAARAGEAGKGFAVVADEVRKLAERSSKATKEISELISTIQENTKRAVQSVDEGNVKVENAGDTFNVILTHVRESASKVAEIAAAGEEQAAQAQEVLLSVQNIASVTEETAAGIEETASTATDLANMAETLNQITKRFKI